MVQKAVAVDAYLCWSPGSSALLVLLPWPIFLMLALFTYQNRTLSHTTSSTLFALLSAVSPAARITPDRERDPVSVGGYLCALGDLCHCWCWWWWQQLKWTQTLPCTRPCFFFHLILLLLSPILPDYSGLFCFVLNPFLPRSPWISI